MKKYTLPLIIFTLSALSVLRAEPDPAKDVPSPEYLQAKLWESSRLQDFKLEGFLRTAKNLHPIIMRTRDREMIFEFQKQPLQIRVIMTESGSIIQRRSSSKEPWIPVTGKQRLEKILDSDAYYEDIGLDFLRWSDVKILGADSIKTLGAWAYEAKPPVQSNYAKTRYWISSAYLAVLRVDAFNEKGQVIKRVEVNGVMKVGNFYTIKEMVIASIIPGRDLSSSRTFIEIRKAESGSGL
ncbi:MAG: outer membrane lipoprotein-sorting protein [Blastochloris sp.]|nr:outer membrane lipoprotein-sorting protein [Blastochloris sp.]